MKYLRKSMEVIVWNKTNAYLGKLVTVYGKLNVAIEEWELNQERGDAACTGIVWEKGMNG